MASATTITGRQVGLPLLLAAFASAALLAAPRLAALASPHAAPLPAFAPLPVAGARHAIWSSALGGVHGESADVTHRMVARAAVAGRSVRVRLGNPYGAAPVRVRAASLGVQWALRHPAAIPGSLHRLTFGGAPTAEIPPGGELTSDPVPVRVEAQQNLLVSVYAPGAPVNDHASEAPTANPPGTFVAALPGDRTLDAAGDAFPAAEVPANDRSPGWHAGVVAWLDLVDAVTDGRGTIVALGDSITDGFRAGGGGDRWTDLLSERIALLEPGARKAVVNAGIAGNTVSRMPNPYDPTGQCCGAPALDRLERDVLAVPGLTDVLLLEGTNDLGGDGPTGPAPAEQVIAALREIAERVHARGARIVVATLLPMGHGAGSDKERRRQRVNAFIRSAGHFDGVVDFDAALRDPADPSAIRPAWRTDGYHPNGAGARQMAQAVDLQLFALPDAAVDFGRFSGGS